MKKYDVVDIVDFILPIIIIESFIIGNVIIAGLLLELFGII